MLGKPQPSLPTPMIYSSIKNLLPLCVCCVREGEEEGKSLHAVGIIIDCNKLL